MSADIKLSKAQISKIIQSDGSFFSWLDDLGKKALTNIAIPLGRDNLPRLGINLALNVITKFERKISGKELSEQEKDSLYLFRVKISATSNFFSGKRYKWKRR